MKGNKLLLIVIIVLVLIIAGGGVFAFMMFKSMTKEPESPIKAEDGVFELGSVPSAGGGHGEGAAAEAAPLTYINNVYMSKKIIKLSMVVECTTKGLPKKIAEAYPAEAKAKMSEINDTINMIISSKTEEQLSGSEAMEKLKEEIKEGIEEIIGKGRVVRINFVEMIKQ